MPCPLRSAALASPNAWAVVSPRGRTSYAELDRRVSAVGARIWELGLEPGGRVALYLPKNLDYLVLLLALIRVGVVACPVSPRLPVGGVAPLLRRVACSALISPHDEPPVGADEVRALGPATLLATSSRDEERKESLEIPLNRPATIVFTSGSTGIPKAALHTYGNHHFSALGSNANIALAPGDRWLHSLPIYHVGGLSILFRCLLAGAAVVLPEPDAPLGEEIPRCGTTHISLVDTQLRRLLRQEADLTGLKAVLLGGGPVSADLLDEAFDRGLPVHTSYGLTETASQATTTPPGASRDELRTSGRVLPHREVTVSAGGEILVRGETLFAGYVEGNGLDPSRTAYGWFRTGDLGTLSADGYLSLAGRKDNMFVSGGENVQPEEIEEALRALEGVEDAVVVPLADAEFGARPVAFVRGPAQREDLVFALERTLPRFKVPTAFHPLSEAGGAMKPNRAALRERARRIADG